MLKRTQDQLASSGDGRYKLRSVRAAINAIEQTTTKITNKADAEAIAGVGSGTAQEIADFLATYRPNVEEQRAHKNAMAVLQQVPGIGISKAEKLVSEGCYTIPHLRRPEYTELLTPVQKTNLKYFEHLRQPVQRAESELVANFIRSSLSSEYEVILTGSYRRGFPISSSIPLMLLHPSYVHVPYPNVSSPFSDAAKERSARRGRVQVSFREKFTKMAAKSQSLLMTQIIPYLEERGLLADTISVGTKKWIGMIRVPDYEGSSGNAIMEKRQRKENIKKMRGEYRKLEINLVPQKSRAAALLALTGDIEFNRDMRLRANKLGMHLDEFGLWRWNSSTPENHSSTSSSAESASTEPPPPEFDPSSVSSNSSSLLPTLVPTLTEESVFEELGLPYVPPDKRNFSYLVSVGKKNTDRPQRMDRIVRAAGGR
ncbi:Nucleotidyltransferase [Dendrothele bispora CBS 962.96]|uniref:DNA polymerase n=1 Tax=Dendrothele bispora (strain CBS 962.96) TaxID=1314807 RepID=A0A4S8MJM6_DENBC|nr:Nucleotidyltransferase [Dendrothele bispora CBS 962.96]